MGTYQKKPVRVEASVWREPGDHPMVESGPDINWGLPRLCEHCGLAMEAHGWIIHGEHIVCPEDVIVTSEDGANVPVKPAPFRNGYELVEGAGPS